MTKIGRNAPCPCGSGKKYKHCCWLRERPAPTIPAVGQSSSTTPPPLVLWDDDGLDDLSNSVVDLLRQGHVDEAESAAAELLKRFPEVVDGLERTAMVEEARGNHALAADYYRKAANFTRTHPDYDPEMTEYYTTKAEQLENTEKSPHSHPSR